MAIFKVPEAFTYARNAGADLSAALYKLGHVDTDGDIVLAGDGEPVIGVITEAAAENSPVTVQFGGIAKCEAGTAVTAGQLVASNNAGETVPAAADDHAFGIALESADDGDIFPVALKGGLGV